MECWVSKQGKNCVWCVKKTGMEPVQWYDPT